MEMVLASRVIRMVSRICMFCNAPSSNSVVRVFMVHPNTSPGFQVVKVISEINFNILE